MPSNFLPARQAVARIVGIDADQVFIEADSGFLMVNWQESMLCKGAQLEAVKRAVLDHVPPQFKGMKVSIT